MFLPTPPSTAHRADKENRPIASSWHVIWSSTDKIHPLSSLPRVPQIRSASKDHPTKSILKKPSRLSPIPEMSKREITPEPGSPQENDKYLVTPLSKIVASDPSMSDLIESYSILTARLRSCIHDVDEVKSSWPLFDPLRERRAKLANAIVRDVGRALVDPLGGALTEKEQSRVLLPSPKQSPKKKRGMDADQVKYARDLCTTTHAVIKFLGFVLTIPAISEIFTDAELRSVMTSVLAIPLAKELPTLYTRKTCALSIWLIQVQRLPAEVLEPAADRIAYALSRGIDGELGKEGKKGSANDGLKAIHDLSLHQPSIFVPAFAKIIPSVFTNLLSPSIVLRLQACHALGGLAMASSTLPASEMHSELSESVATFLTTTPPKLSPSKNKNSLAHAEAPIVRTLRTTLSATDPLHVAHGPVWGLHILASFLALLRSRVYEDQVIFRIISALFQLPMRHKKNSVRGLLCVVWRVITWVYFQPRLISSDEPTSSTGSAHQLVSTRENWWKFVKTIVSMHAGISTLAALFGSGATSEVMDRAVDLLEHMMHKRDSTFKDALAVMRRLIGFETPDVEWDWGLLTPHSLFSSNPGLLTVDFTSLQTVVSPMYEECAGVDDIRSLSKEELVDGRILTAFFNAWRKGLAGFGLNDAGTISEVTLTWKYLLHAHLITHEESGRYIIDEVAQMAVETLEDILKDSNVTTHAPSPSSSPVNTPIKIPRCTPAALLKLKVVQDLWTVTRELIPKGNLCVANRLLACLMKNESDLTDGDECVRKEWASLCAQVAVVCELEELKAFWSFVVDAEIPAWKWNWSEAVRSIVWRGFTNVWHHEGTWEGIIVLLNVPFLREHVWDLTDDDFREWESLLGIGVEKAFDYGMDASEFIDSVAANVSQSLDPTFTSATRITDAVISRVDMADVRQIPTSLVDLVSETLRMSYPPEPSNMTTSFWMVRSLVRMLETCPPELISNVLSILQEGLSLWISDEFKAFKLSDYSGDILSLYEVVLMSMQNLPRDHENLAHFGVLIEAVFYGREDKPQGIFDAFTDFWQDTFSTKIPLGGWPQKVRAFFGICEPLEGPDPDELTLHDTCPQGEAVEETPLELIMFTTPPSSPIQTPVRPHKSPTTFSRHFDIMLYSPESPTLSGRASRRSSAGKKVKSVDNKENVPLSTPVTRSVKDKRRLSSDSNEGPIPKKRKSRHVKESPSTEDKIQKVLAINVYSPNSDVFSSGGSSSGRRKRIIMESVEVPTLREVNRRRLVGSGKDLDSSPLGSFDDMLFREIGRKRSGSSSSSFGSNCCDDSASPPTMEPASSDDDPHYGQVTPHHLISPDIPSRRTEDNRHDQDPPSDDSVVCPSPTKDVIQRRLQRRSSGSPKTIY
ncbi:uncharacterized protein BT62DRAFT_972705 [Guyanagaster necrorhizus]|uniref:Telomere-associated protein Rif1 N-terminal domain-containing protein n=1 Tax=Guyanagaster necrorhizus TaxID=856835 RepID=A0A9P7VLZ5_9AGAR|nr:uncharacterized protein BT62DRAFT_972705 [Guyanagaster necrorhizus MCA 3950]KAG7442975.1 hypothetical protein BT62DRAFT_972705 [Guyanagaster necrorhizus MCA 3950]